MYTNTDQSGFMQSTLDYGDIHLHLATDEEMVLEDIPNPKTCVMEIEKLKNYTVIRESKSHSYAQKKSQPKKSKKIISQSEEDSLTKENQRKSSKSSKSYYLLNKKKLKKELKKEIKNEIEHKLREKITQEVRQEFVDKLDS
jgi:hypothetical protein